MEPEGVRLVGKYDVRHRAEDGDHDVELERRGCFSSFGSSAGTAGGETARTFISPTSSCCRTQEARKRSRGRFRPPWPRTTSPVLDSPSSDSQGGRIRRGTHYVCVCESETFLQRDSNDYDSTTRSNRSCPRSRGTSTCGSLRSGYRPALPSSRPGIVYIALCPPSCSEIDGL
jgi:hypothetical protein